MKKFLSLVLALVMTMSLVTVSAGAKDFTDNDKVTYDEAVQVISMLGIVNGYEDGSFKPTNTLTRGAAAKIIANLKLTPAVADTLKGSKTTFKDVPETNVFSGYIAYCASEGIINGYRDGTFRPAGTLNGYAFMKMLLGALGYDTAIEQYTGSGWEVRVATRANRVGLTDGNDAFVGSKAVTREEACLYAFNTLNAEVVEYENKGTNITINGVTIATGASAAKPIVVTEKVNGETKSHNQLYREANFAKLKPVDDATDTFGRPAIKWAYGKKSVSVAAEPDLSYKGIVSTKDLVADLGLKKADGTKTFNYNGTPVSVSKATATDDAAFGSTHMTGTYVYQVSANAYDVFTVTYQYGKVVKVNAANAKNETERNILLNNGKTFETEQFAAKDAVLFALGTDGNVADVVSVETVTGTATAKKGDKIVVNGTSYYNTVGVLVNDEGTFTLSFDGAAIIKKDAVGGVESNLYAYVLNTRDAGTTYDENGNPITGTNVYFVKADGTKAVALKASDSAAVEAGKAYNYVLNSKGEFKAIGTAVDAAQTNTLNKTQIIKVDNNTSYLASNTTKYVFVKNSGNYDVTTVTGYTNAKTKVGTTATIYAVANEDKMALTVFVIGEATGVDTNKQYVFLTDAEATETTVDKNTVYTFSVYGTADGTLKTTDSAVANTIAGLKKGARFSYTLLNGYVTAVEPAAASVGTYAAPVTVDNVVEDAGYFVVGNQAYVFAKDVTVYVYDAEATDAAKVITESTVDAVTAETKVVFWTNDSTANQADIIVIIAE